eukprot:8512566-Pyramimonas_sp.AAC.1
MERAWIPEKTMDNASSWAKGRRWNLRAPPSPPASPWLPFAPRKPRLNWPPENQVDLFNRPFCGAR